MAWGLKTKLGLGLLATYTLFEIYMQLRTQYVIYHRRQQAIAAAAAASSSDDDADVARFRSVNISGMFVNPFQEYRPQTAFEFMVVRFMEWLESIYGVTVALHQPLPKPHDGACDVEDVLKRFKPSMDQYRHNSRILSQCLASGDFTPYTEPGTPQPWWQQLRDGNNNAPITSLPPVRDQVLFTWLGQLCGLLQVLGINFLTDPQLGDHLMLTKFGPQRLTKTPMQLGDIRYATDDNLNFVLVSHDHPDHLEMALIPQLGNQATWIVPLGFKKKLARRGVHNVVEMDWWDTVDLNPLLHPLANVNGDRYELVCVPAMHWLGRYVVDSNTTLWCSYIVRKNGELIAYHAGDTGYCRDLFAAIGARYGPTLLLLLPIGQYCPLWHQKPRHISPEEALKLCDHLQTKYMKGVHWGTFKLSGESILEPKETLAALAAAAGTGDRYRTPEFGLTYMYDLGSGAETELYRV